MTSGRSPPPYDVYTSYGPYPPRPRAGAVRRRDAPQGDPLGGALLRQPPRGEVHALVGLVLLALAYGRKIALEERTLEEGSARPTKPIAPRPGP